MKLIIAHLPDDALESVRTELLDLGVLRITAWQVYSSGPQSTVRLMSRGAPLQTHLRSELRMECVVATEQSPAVVGLLRHHASTRWGLGGRVVVLDLDELHQSWPEDHVFADDPRLDSVV